MGDAFRVRCCGSSSEPHTRPYGSNVEDELKSACGLAVPPASVFGCDLALAGRPGLLEAPRRVFVRFYSRVSRVRNDVVAA